MIKMEIFLGEIGKTPFEPLQKERKEKLVA
jgi:hypothetical protein